MILSLQDKNLRWSFAKETEPGYNRTSSIYKAGCCQPSLGTSEEPAQSPNVGLHSGTSEFKEA